MPDRRRIGAGVVAAVLLGAGVAGGFGWGEHTGGDSIDTVSAVAGRASATNHNKADVTFAQMMVPHHESALAMVQMADGQGASAAVRTLADQIGSAQTPEIATMQGWLSQWGAKPGTGQMTGEPSDAVMTGADMDQLAKLSGADFDREFLTLMIQHHHGAVEMAQTELTEGENADALALAASIEVSQEGQIQQMREMLNK